MLKTSPQCSLPMNTRGPADPRAEAIPGSKPGHQGAVGSSPRAGALAFLTPSVLLLAQRLLRGVHLGVGGLVTEHHRPSGSGPTQALPNSYPNRRALRTQRVTGIGVGQPSRLTPTGPY